MLPARGRCRGAAPGDSSSTSAPVRSVRCSAIATRAAWTRCSSRTAIRTTAPTSARCPCCVGTVPRATTGCRASRCLGRTESTSAVLEIAGDTGPDPSRDDLSEFDFTALQHGARVSLGPFDITVARAYHPVPALAYRIEGPSPVSGARNAGLHRRHGSVRRGRRARARLRPPARRGGLGAPRGEPARYPHEWRRAWANSPRRRAPPRWSSRTSRRGCRPQRRWRRCATTCRARRTRMPGAGLRGLRRVSPRLGSVP